MQQFDMKPLDLFALMDIHRKNMEALSEAGTLTLGSFQTIMKRQADYFSQIVEDSSKIMHDAAKSGTPAEKAARHTDLVKKTYEKSITNLNDIADIIGKSGKEASKVVHGRVASSLTELKSALHKNNNGSALKKAA